ncbi:hypothetical protein AST06_11810 [Staphylococcus saprophyticus]|uniref:hypothetical protein n=1 Tax=Staphylococcus saprophyticus TaxID=29385 RepID=UPI000853DC89|nr:hypothetical protein [Staphylococcus saprophyticus]OEK72711.1 hypothetical protein AST06_11810 [Staphylococcus saprophyticus]
MCGKYLKPNNSKASNKSDKTKPQNSNFNHKKLQPKIKPKFIFMEESKKSVNVKEVGFTNFLSDKNKEETKLRLEYLTSNVNELENLVNEENGKDETDNILNNIDTILLKMYDDNYFSNYKETKYFKARIKTQLGQSTSFRLFLVKDIEYNNYPIVLVDPLHLAVKSSRQYEKPNRYEDNKGNGLCLSNIFNHINIKSIFK